MGHRPLRPRETADGVGTALRRARQTTTVTSPSGAPMLPGPRAHGPVRPGVAAAAAGFALAAAVWTLFVGLLVSLGGSRTACLAAAASTAAMGLAIGARRVLSGRGRRLLVASAVGSAAAITVAAFMDQELRSDGVAGVLIWLAFALAPPTLTAALALVPRVSDWLAEGRTSPPAQG